MFVLTRSPEKAPKPFGYVEVEFSGGIPVRSTGGKWGPAKLLDHLNALGGKHGIGRVDLVEEPVRGDEVPRRIRDAGRDDPARGAPGVESLTLDAR